MPRTPTSKGLPGETANRFLPSSWAGWATVVLGTAVIVLAALLPRAQTVLHGRFGDNRGLVGFVLVLALLACAAGAFSYTRHAERSRLFLVILAVLVLVTGFWLLFAIGNLLSPA